jgi:hypothetical protein
MFANYIFEKQKFKYSQNEWIFDLGGKIGLTTVIIGYYWEIQNTIYPYTDSNVDHELELFTSHATFFLLCLTIIKFISLPKI